MPRELCSEESQAGEWRSRKECRGRAFSALSRVGKRAGKALPLQGCSLLRRVWAVPRSLRAKLDRDDGWAGLAGPSTPPGSSGEDHQPRVGTGHGVFREPSLADRAGDEAGLLVGAALDQDQPDRAPGAGELVV